MLYTHSVVQNIVIIISRYHVALRISFSLLRMRCGPSCPCITHSCLKHKYFNIYLHKNLFPHHSFLPQHLLKHLSTFLQPGLITVHNINTSTFTDTRTCFPITRSCLRTLWSTSLLSSNLDSSLSTINTSNIYLHKNSLPHHSFLSQHLLKHLSAFLQPRLIARINHKDHSINFSIIVLPNVSDLFSTTKIIYGDIASFHLETDTWETHGRGDIFYRFTLYSFDCCCFSSVVKTN